MIFVIVFRGMFMDRQPSTDSATYGTRKDHDERDEKDPEHRNRKTEDPPPLGAC